MKIFSGNERTARQKMVIEVGRRNFFEDGKEEIGNHADFRIEAENRIRNLIWTVSGDYDLNLKVDVDSFARSKYISLYDAVKQGAFVRYFDREELSMYIVKKIFLSANEQTLMDIVWLCTDAAIRRRLEDDRKGVSAIRKKAFEDILEKDFECMPVEFLGRLRLAWLRYGLDTEYMAQERIMEVLRQISALETAENTLDIITVADRLYNTYADSRFEKTHGTLNDVLAVTMEELTEFDWKDFLKEEALEETLEEYLRRVSQTVTSSVRQQEKEKDKERKKDGGKTIVKLTDDDVRKMYAYIELNYGRSYLSGQEQEKQNFYLCQGAHADCSLYFTEGILKSPVKNNYQYQYAKRQAEENRKAYRSNYQITKKNIGVLADILRMALVKRSEAEVIRADNGMIIPSALWRAGRVSEPRLFTKVIRQNQTDFVVDILIDASGSQRIRQEQVALQGYIISEALSRLNIPHRVMSFCTFWDYTILHRFREYDDDASANKNIFNYMTSSNNRDGLAIRAACASLSARNEENRILIVLSDGRPNDIIINRPGSRNPKPYGGEYAVKDTALEVRRARAAGISVLGVFAGKEEDLAAEKKIFGKDFAYIRNIAEFSHVVGIYLKRQVEE